MLQVHILYNSYQQNYELKRVKINQTNILNKIFLIK